MILSVLCLILSVTLTQTAELQWVKMEDALKQAKERTLPILLLSTRTDCKPCKKLMKDFEESKEFEEQSKKFILAKAEDKEIAKLGPYKTEGKYVPKVVFINHNGILMKELDNKNKKSEKTRYFYKKVSNVLISAAVALEHQYLDSGFGKDYLWYDWTTGLAAAKEQNKPILVIFHQDWCGACQRLKPIFASADDIKEIASKFIMINTDEDDIVKGDKYKADGEYYPKILFLDSDGELITEEMNYGTKHKHVLHYYGNGKEVRASMDRVLANITEAQNINDHDFGKHIKWVSYKKGLQLSKDLKKPMMMIFTKSYCGACKALKPKIKNSKEFAEMTKQFVMVTLEDELEADDDQFDIDGAYIPRIFFLGSDGKVEPTIRNEGKVFKKSRYAYGTPEQIIENMKKALEMKLGDRVDQPKEEQKQEQQTKQPQEQEQQQQPKTEEPPKTTTYNDGFSDNIKWYNYVEGVQEAKKSNMIGAVFFYNNYCVFSRFMKEQFNESPQVTELSKKFVMIHVSEAEAGKTGDKYDVDGRYTPRLFFIDPDENVHADLNNSLAESVYDQTLFYYGTAAEIVKVMNAAQEKINVSLGRGFGEYIQWKTFHKGLEICKEQNMPMMLIIHRTWCGACKALKPKIRDSREIWELSRYFVMVNTEDSEEPLDEEFFIDGGYYPRILFLDSQGKVHHDLHCRDPKMVKYKYSYAYEEQIIQTMKFAIAKFWGNTNNQQQEEKQQEQQQTQNTETPKEESKKEEKMLSPGKKLLAKSGVKWRTINESLDEAKKTGKPIMFLIHRTTCPACKATIKLITRDEELKEKTEGFILADIEDDVDDALADSYDIDGTYVPRIYFLDPDGKIFKDIWNVGTNYLDNKFYFFEISSIYRAMEKTKKKMESWKTGDQANESNIVVKQQKDEL